MTPLPERRDNRDIERRVGDLEGDVKVIKQRLEGSESWIKESKEFHKKMNTWMDQTLGAREAEAKVQKERHESNIERFEELKRSNGAWNLLLTVISVIIAACMLFLTAKSLLHSKADPSDLFHISEQSVLAQESQPQISVK